MHANSPTLAPIIPFLADLSSAVAPLPQRRFTLDGDATLEGRLEGVCSMVRAGVEQMIPARALEGIVLVGDYGRGEGGVTHSGSESSDHSYHALEFRVFVRGNLRLNRWRYRSGLSDLAAELSATSGMAVDFELASVGQLRRMPLSLASYNLVHGHRRVGSKALSWRGCEHHERAADIPASEATRVVMDRCSRLLFALQSLDRLPCSADALDHVGSHLVEARLALGDAVLIAFGEYHCSYRERQRRLDELDMGAVVPNFDEIRSEFARAVEFKRHPNPAEYSEFELREGTQWVTHYAQELWLWLESRRLEIPFSSLEEYVRHPAEKCPETRGWKNCLLNVLHFGPLALLEAAAGRHPRERLYRTLPILMWQPELLEDGTLRTKLKCELRTEATTEPEWVAAYQRLWTDFA